MVGGRDFQKALREGGVPGDDYHVWKGKAAAWTQYRCLEMSTPGN